MQLHIYTHIKRTYVSTIQIRTHNIYMHINIQRYIVNEMYQKKKILSTGRLKLMNIFMVFTKLQAHAHFSCSCCWFFL